MKKLTAPRHVRKGQALFLFLHWMHQNKRGSAMKLTSKLDRIHESNYYLADPFYVSDEDLEKWWDEFVTHINADIVEAGKD